MSALLFIFVILSLVTGVVILIHNTIIKHFNATIRAWSDVISFERQKLKTLEELTPVVEQYTSMEKSTLEKVTELRQNIMNLNVNQADPTQLQRVEALSKELFRSLNVVVENYPELKANQLYIKMMDEVDEQNENVGAAITIYNRNVEVFNTYIQVFPNHLVNTSFSKKKSIRPFKDNTASQSFDYRPNF
jgi:LemA protein